MKYVIAGFAALAIGTTVHELAHVFVGRAISGEWPRYEFVQVTQLVPFTSDLQLRGVAISGPLVELFWIGLVGGAAIVSRGRHSTILAAAFGMLAVRAWAVSQLWVDAARTAPGADAWRYDLSKAASTFEGNEYLALHIMSALNALPIFFLLGAVVVLTVRARGRRWGNVAVAAQGVSGAGIALFTLLMARVFQALF
ncbi:MAG: hypothetical protein O6922_06430 [Chloroflexi bacterium]|nr:hypothetical protein [Chloroflexota bacterium]